MQQDFTASGANQKWAGYITYVWTREGWVYLAVIIDFFSRRVVGWSISNRLKQDLTLRALNMGESRSEGRRAAAFITQIAAPNTAPRLSDASSPTRVQAFDEREKQLS